MQKLLTDETFETVAKAVISEPDIRNDLENNGVLPQAYAYLISEKKEILAPLSAIDLDYDKAVTAIAEAKIRAQQHVPPWLRYMSADEGAPIGIGCLAVFILVALVGAGSYYGVARLDAVGNSKYVVVVALGVAIGFLWAVMVRLAKRLQMRAETTEGIPSLMTREKQAEAKGREELGRALRDALRTLINTVMRLEENYTLVLPKVRFEGLAERMDAKLFVSTRTKTELYKQMEQMPCGTIGIAGPRGVGKTTLLKSITDEINSATAEAGRKRDLSLFTSVPVEYQGRDFILHLFASLCRAVIDDAIRQRVLTQSAAALQKRPLIDLMREVQSASLARTWEALRPIAWALVAIGAVLLVLSAFGTPQSAAIPKTPVAETTAASPQGKAAASPPTAPKGEAPSQSPKGGASQPKGTNAEPEGRKTEPTAQQPNPGAAEPKPGGGYLQAAIKPDIFLLWGIVCLILGLTGLLKAYEPAFSRLLRRSEAQSPADRDGSTTRTQDSTASNLNPRQREELLSLIDAAQQALMEIKYQRSYTSGWAGALKLPVALETSANAASTLAETQRSLPEIVEAYRQFMTTMTAHFRRVVIAIDELDKLESQEVVFRFMNEIKVLFGIENCFYLISVSDAAISDFERRGMNFSNVFDSALDTMVQATYFRRKECRALINKRTVGLPQSFLAVLEAVSAALPRDFVRAARDLDRESTELRESAAKQAALSTIVNNMTKSDVSAKLFAIVTTVKTLKVEPATSDFLEIIQHLKLALEGSLLTSAALLEVCNKLCERLRKEEAAHANAADENEDRQRLMSRIQELAAYLYLSATIVDVFGDKLTEQALRSHDDSGAIRQLVRARQDLRIHPGIAFTRATSLRESLGLEVIRSYWTTPSGITDEDDG